MNAETATNNDKPNEEATAKSEAETVKTDTKSVEDKPQTQEKSSEKLIKFCNSQ